MYYTHKHFFISSEACGGGSRYILLARAIHQKEKSQGLLLLLFIYLHVY